MRRVKRWRYYCDFCKKSGGNSLAIHELHCVKNPNRECRMCARLEIVQQPIAELIAALDMSFVALREKADGCPVCMLAAIVQRRTRPGFSFEQDSPEVEGWNFKAALTNASSECDESERQWRNAG